MSTVRVSVVLPTLNRAEQLPRAMRSVLSQTFGDLELIVVDDGSTQDLRSVVESFGDTRVVYVRHDCRRGAAAARNTGIRSAKGEYLAFQDSDDEWLPGKLEKQLALIESCGPSVGWVGGGWISEDKGELRSELSQNLVRGEAYDSDLAYGAPFVTATWLVRRQILIEAGLFDESIPCLEDWDLILRLADRCRFRGVNDYVLRRHGSADSLYGDVNRRRLGLEAVLTRHQARFRAQPGWHAYWCAELARLLIESGQRRNGLRWLLRAVTISPYRALRARGLLRALLRPGRAGARPMESAGQ